MEHWQPVEFTGEDTPEFGIYQGHPGRILDVGQLPVEVAVGFVNGPSHCLPVGLVRALSEEEYLTRGRRLVALLHPLRDHAIRRYNAVGHEWVDGAEPGAP